VSKTKVICFAMRLLINGHFETIIVDDYIPYNTKFRCPEFAGKKTNNIWPILLEKAWAKVNGSYEDIVTGHTSESLGFFIPYPVIKYRHEELKTNEEKQLWNTLQDSIENEYLIVATTNSEEEKEDMVVDVSTRTKKGLPSNHCFSITAHYVLKVRGKYVNLLQINNPWDKQEWKGAWSDFDPMWTTSLKSAVKFHRKRKGEFFMTFKDFLKYFHSTNICKFDPFLTEKTLKLTHSKDSY
jgi:calpain-15